MKHSIKHPLPPDRAKKMLDRLFDVYCKHYEEYDLETSWSDDQTAQIGMKVKGREISGQVKVCDDSYEVDIQLPRMVRLFKGRIRKELDATVAEWVAAEKRSG